MIRNREKFMESLWNWDLFKGCFPRGILPSDIDGHVEINCRWLFIEAKGRGVPIPRGQEIDFQRLATYNPRITVLVLWGDPGAPEEFLLMPHMQRGKCDADRVRAFAAAWAKWAEAAPRDDERAAFRVTLAARPVASSVTATPSRGATSCTPGCTCDLCKLWPMKVA